MAPTAIGHQGDDSGNGIGIFQASATHFDDFHPAPWLIFDKLRFRFGGSSPNCLPPQDGLKKKT
jgi:hypothetical protein